MSHSERLITAGVPLETAERALILVHGRGQRAEGMLPLAERLEEALADRAGRPGSPGGPLFAHLAPQAEGNTWYPLPFLAPIEQNEPYLSAALRRLADLLDHVASQGIPPERSILVGFSQGACLASEFAARNARRYGGLILFSGGLIGPAGTPREYAGSLAETPVFIGCSEADPHIPLARAEETAEILRRLGGRVTTWFYPGASHTITRPELERAAALMAEAASG